ncbi:rhodanese-like domain-containing protein 11, chloroplastic isoform X2 [Lycium ferocissimum]|uniref:rhodanese-like domain-containing protein 11, chloroplastic isoform X2 n=1 Tax=Lycium ferocissimum TaxID=112874 RepID=UPI0028156A70|nr:rhodanese-like domain-containing protein 11, chloroplastic isoform X2 [Lycium ferocissimum]
MEVLGHGHGLLPLGSFRPCQKQQRCQLVGSIHFLSSPVPYSLISVKVLQEEEYELKQMKDMAASKKRWDALIRDGKVKVLTPREAGYAIQLSNKMLVDVRPSMERKKAWVKGSTWIPIFDVDTSLELGTLSRKATNFLMGGWWSGVPALSYNRQFLSNVEEKFGKDTDLIVACQKGLRSIAACEVLYNAGYSNIFWVQGGLEAAEEEDLEREGPQPFKFAGIGGLSEFLGWTDQQRDAAAKEGWGYRLTFSARLVGLVLGADVLLIGAQKVGQYLQDLRSH